MIINRAPNSGPSKRKKRPPAADVVVAGTEAIVAEAAAALPDEPTTHGQAPASQRARPVADDRAPRQRRDPGPHSV